MRRGNSVPEGTPIAIDSIDPTGWPASAMRAGLDEAAVEDYSQIIDQLPPIDVAKDPQTGLLWLLNGAHRLAAAKKAGRAEIKACFVMVDRQGAWAHAAKANCANGVRITRADKRAMINAALDDPDMAGLSDVVLAERCGVSDKTIAAVRGERTSEIPRLDDGPVKRVGRDGRARKAPAKKAAKLDRKAKEPKPEPLSDSEHLERALARRRAAAEAPEPEPPATKPVSADDIWVMGAEVARASNLIRLSVARCPAGCRSDFEDRIITAVHEMFDSLAKSTEAVA
jgi:hypothetical protein